MDIAVLIRDLAPWIAAIVIVTSGLGIFASHQATKMKIKNGYPLEGMWGQSLKPGETSESMERVKLLTQENAALRAEVSSIKERLANVERIVTDSGFHLSQQFAALKDEDAGMPLDMALHRERSRS